MSDEETRPDAPETASGEASVGSAEPTGESASSEATSGDSVPAAAASSEDAAPTSDAAGGSHAVVKEAAAPHAAFAATVLGDTLPSAVRSASSGGAGDHGHGGSAHGGHGDEHFAHTLPMTVLGGVLGALIVLTVLTVAVTSVDLGSQGNFIVAMIIATIKAALVMGYFMHLVWDSKFNVFVFLSSFFFVMLFLSMALLDRQEYQTGIDTFEADQKATAK